MTKRYFFTNEDALIFVAKVNGRRESLRHYEAALQRDDLTVAEKEFLVRTVGNLKTQIAELRAGA